MAKKVLTVDLATGQEKLVQQIVDAAPATEAEKQEVSYSVKAVDDTIATINQNISDLQSSVGTDVANQIDAVNTAIDTLEQNLESAKNEASYQNAVKDKLADQAARDALVSVAEGDRYLVGNDIHVYHIEVPAQGETPAVPAHWDVITALKGMQLVDLTNDVEYFFDGAAWIDKLGNLTTAYENADTTLTNALAQEVTDRTNAVAAEKTRAEGIESGLQTSISDEVTRATAAEGTLTTNLASEVTRATDAESALQTAINDEVTRATAAEATAQANAEATAQAALNAKTHNSLQGLQGGTETERYHLDNATYTKVNALASDDQLVHKTGDESIAGNKTFSNDVIVQGNFTVTGTATTINTENLIIKDNIITLNDSEPDTNSGVSLGKAGFEINRGSASKANLYFDETDDLFKAGLAGTEKIVARVDDTNSASTSETYSASKIEAIKSDLNLAIINSSLVTFVADGAIVAGQVVYGTIAGKAKVADNTDTTTANAILGIAVDSAVDGGVLRVASTGKITGFSSLTVGAQVFLGTTGQIMQAPFLGSEKVLNVIGVAVANDSICLGLGKSILL